MRVRNGMLRSLLALLWPALDTAVALAGSKSAAESPDALLRTGLFGRAEGVLAQRIEIAPRDVAALVQSGYLALLRNGLDDAERRLTAALAIEPRQKDAKALLAEVYYRRDDFARAAPLFEATGERAKARKLASFGSRQPYAAEGAFAVTRVPFLKTDPLPVISVTVNGSESVRCLVDTGGGELILSTDLAKRTNLPRFGSERGFFAGGRRAGLEHGRAATVALADLVVRDVPVMIMDLSGIGPAVGEARIDGIVGTVFLYHFLSTIDYTGGQLVLERLGERPSTSVPGEVAIPFWMAGDHFMVARGRVDDGAPLLFFVDTGLAGAGFAAPSSTLAKAALTPRRDQGQKGMGAGGEIEVVPFVVDQLSLGDLRRPGIDGVAGAFPPQLEWGLGFHIGGLVSHQFFRESSLTLDFRSMRLLVRPTVAEPLDATAVAPARADPSASAR